MPDLPELNVETYLGDGLYVSFDGYHIRLRAPRIGGDHWVAMEQPVYHALMRWVADHSALWEHFATGSPKRRASHD